MVTLVAAVVVFAVANLRAPVCRCGLWPDWKNRISRPRWRQNWPRWTIPLSPVRRCQRPSSRVTCPGKQSLVPRGTETRIGDAILALVDKERGGPIAGIVVMTDGGNNAGIECSVATQAARVAGIPLYAVGLGSDQQPVNARVVDLEAPKRVYPGRQVRPDRLHPGVRPPRSPRQRGAFFGPGRRHRRRRAMHRVSRRPSKKNAPCDWPTMAKWSPSNLK